VSSGAPTRASRSVKARLERAGGRPAGFDYLRIALAVSIVCWHSIVTSYGPEVQYAVWHSPARIGLAMILPLFFALSGFLVAGSLERTKTLPAFLALRAIRIIPALGVEILVSALILGPVFTTVPLSEYFRDPEFHSYFWNIVGFVHFSLPGVFSDNPSPNMVNGQLWTVPLELDCYIALAVLALLRIIKKRVIFLIAVALLQLAFGARGLFGSYVDETTVPPRLLILCFLVGATLFRFRDKVPYSRTCACAALVIFAILLWIPRGSYFSALPAAYLVTYAGLLDPRRIWLVRSGDYSYGIYLYGYVIQQAVMNALPWSRTWYLNIATSLPLIFLLSFASWHGLEKHVLRLRSTIHAMELRWISRRDKLPRWITFGANSATLAEPL
jgi:peptidoglycan/LPS O-acetylase OafA/YrhL